MAVQDQKMLAEKFDIDLTVDVDEVIKQKLLLITRTLPDLEKEIGKDWSPEVKAKLDKIIEQRQK